MSQKRLIRSMKKNKCHTNKIILLMSIKINICKRSIACLNNSIHLMMKEIMQVMVMLINIINTISMTIMHNNTMLTVGRKIYSQSWPIAQPVDSGIVILKIKFFLSYQLRNYKKFPRFWEKDLLLKVSKFLRQLSLFNMSWHLLLFKYCLRDLWIRKMNGKWSNRKHKSSARIIQKSIPKK